MSICAWCGLQFSGDSGICPHHSAEAGGNGWAAVNRIMCDGLHRDRWAGRLSEPDRVDDARMHVGTGESAAMADVG